MFNIYKRIDIPFYFFTFYAQLHFGYHGPQKFIRVTINKKNKLLWIGNFVIGFYFK